MESPSDEACEILVFSNEFAQPNSHACAPHNKVGDGELHTSGYSIHIHRTLC